MFDRDSDYGYFEEDYEPVRRNGYLAAGVVAAATALAVIAAAGTLSVPVVAGALSVALFEFAAVAFGLERARDQVRPLAKILPDNHGPVPYGESPEDLL